MAINSSIDTIANLTTDEAEWIQDHYLELARVNTRKYPRDQARDIVQFYADTGIPPDNVTLDEIFKIGCGIEDHLAKLKREQTQEKTCNTHYWNIMITFKGAAGSTLPVDLIEEYLGAHEALRFLDKVQAICKKWKRPN